MPSRPPTEPECGSAWIVHLVDTLTAALVAVVLVLIVLGIAVKVIGVVRRGV